MGNVNNATDGHIERTQLYKRLNRIRTAIRTVDSATATIHKELNLSNIKEADDGTV